MKRLVCSALLLVLLAAPQVQAQSFDLGVKGGVNLANVSTNIPTIEDIKTSNTGFVGGAFLGIGLGSVFSIQPELLYSQKGFSAEEGDLEASLNTNYLEIPLLVKANLDAGLLRPAIYAGPVLSFETSCNFSLAGISEDCDVGDDFTERKTTEWGLDFGANLDILLGPIMLVADARYQLGLTNLADVDTDEEVKTRMWQFMAGIGFSL